MQPPETEPMSRPSSRMASCEPTGRGDEPQVETTVASSALRPLRRHSRRARKTLRSEVSFIAASVYVGCKGQSAMTSASELISRAYRPIKPGPANPGTNDEAESASSHAVCLHAILPGRAVADVAGMTRLSQRWPRNFRQESSRNRSVFSACRTPQSSIFKTGCPPLTCSFSTPAYWPVY